MIDCKPSQKQYLMTPSTSSQAKQHTLVPTRASKDQKLTNLTRESHVSVACLVHIHHLPRPFHP
jgi:hypothetical protein